jgi:hypothetical protein
VLDTAEAIRYKRSVRLIAISVGAACFIAASATSGIAKSGESNSAAARRVCETVRLLGDWGGQRGVVEVANGSFLCATAMRIARAASSKPFKVGETLPAPAGWDCAASLRPESGYRPRYVLGCWQHGASSRPQIGVRYPTP